MKKDELAKQAAQVEQPKIPQGWPTNAMIDAGRRAAESHGPLLGNGQSLWHIFSAMLSAAPATDTQLDPVFWYKPLKNGFYEGPHHNNSGLGKMQRDEEPGKWFPLYTTPPASSALVEAAELIRIFQNNMGPHRGVLTEEDRILWDRANALRADIEAEKKGQP